LFRFAEWVVVTVGDFGEVGEASRQFRCPA
jgi:hypothetical protein